MYTTRKARKAISTQRIGHSHKTYSRLLRGRKRNELFNLCLPSMERFCINLSIFFSSILYLRSSSQVKSPCGSSSGERDIEAKQTSGTNRDNHTVLNI